MSTDGPAAPLTASAPLGDGLIRLTVDANHAAWEGVLTGRVAVEAGRTPLDLISLQWAIHDALTPLNAFPVLGPSRRIDSLSVPVNGKWEQPLHLKLDTSVRSLGGGHEVSLMAVSAPYRETHIAGIPLELLPPARFVGIAARLAEMAGLRTGVWRTVSDGDGAEVDLSPPEGSRTGPHLRLTLFRGGSGYGELRRMARNPFGLLTAASRKIEVHPSGDPETELARAYALLSDSRTLPIPARPAPSSEGLPIPSEPDPRL